MEKNQSVKRTKNVIASGDGRAREAGVHRQAERNRQADLQELKTLRNIEIKDRKNSTLITVRAKVLFDLRSAKVKRSAMPTLDRIAKFLARYPDHAILVGGHTDSLPTRTDRFPSNWELSAMRAVNVVKYLSRMKGLNPSRLIASGFGQHHPISSNKTASGRQLNRRVEIHLIRGGFPTKAGDSS